MVRINARSESLMPVQPCMYMTTGNFRPVLASSSCRDGSEMVVTPPPIMSGTADWAWCQVSSRSDMRPTGVGALAQAARVMAAARAVAMGRILKTGPECCGAGRA